MSGISFAQLALAGQCYVGSTAATGVDIPIYNATAAHTAVLFNPSGSGVNALLNWVAAGQADASTPAISGLGLSFLTNAQGPATGAAVVTFTDALVQNAIIGKGGAKCRFGAASLSATTLLGSIGFSQDSVTPGANIDAVVFYANGSIVLPPATCLALVGAPIAFGQAMVASMGWAEIPIN